MCTYNIYSLANGRSVNSIGIRCSSSKRVTTSVCATAGMFYCAMLRQHIQFTCKIQLNLLPAKRLLYPRITSGDMRLKQFLPKQPQSPSLSDVTTASAVVAASSRLYVSLSPEKWQGSRSGHVLPHCPTPPITPSHHVLPRQDVTTVRVFNFGIIGAVKIMCEKCFVMFNQLNRVRCLKLF